MVISSLFSQEKGRDTKSILAEKVNEQKAFQKLLDSSNNFYNTGEYTKSLELNMKILNIAFKKDNPYFIHQGYRYLAYDYLFLNDTILAMDSFKKSENYAKLSKNDTATAVTYMDLANVYSTYEEYTKAFLYFDRFINLFKKIKDSVGFAKAHYNLVLTTLDIEDYNKAYINILKAIEEAKKEKLSMELENAYYLYSESLYEQKRYEEAYEVFKIYDEYSDENSGIFTSSERYSLSQKYKLEEYRKDIKAANLNMLLQEEIVKSKSRINFILIIVSACFLVLLIALYSNSIKRIKLVKELRKKNIEALLAKEQSEKLSEAKVKFFSTVSHELRTPLYGVIGLSSILLEDESLRKHKKDLKLLKFSADYLLALINDVLQINKIDSNNMEDDQTSFKVRELIETITSSFEYLLIQNDNKIHIEVSEKIPELISGNSTHLSQVLMNLISNACKFTENGEIFIKVKTVAVSNQKAAIKFTIKDLVLAYLLLRKYWAYLILKSN